MILGRFGRAFLALGDFHKASEIMDLVLWETLVTGGQFERSSITAISHAWRKTGGLCAHAQPCQKPCSGDRAPVDNSVTAGVRLSEPLTWDLFSGSTESLRTPRQFKKKATSDILGNSEAFSN